MSMTNTVLDTSGMLKICRIKVEPISAMGLRFRPAHFRERNYGKVFKSKVAIPVHHTRFNTSKKVKEFCEILDDGEWILLIPTYNKKNKLHKVSPKSVARVFKQNGVATVNILPSLTRRWFWKKEQEADV